MKKKRSLILGVAIVVVLTALALVAYHLIFKADVSLAMVVLAVFGFLLFIVFVAEESFQDENNRTIASNINKSITSALAISNSGLLVYDDNNRIVWMSELFRERHLDHQGEKLTAWLPELRDLLQGSVDVSVVVINDEKFEVSRQGDDRIILFKDITEIYDMKKSVVDGAYVLGLVSYDNYDESMENEDDISYVNSNIKLPVIDYFKKFHITYKTLRNNRLFLIMNEKQFNLMHEDRFSILNTVRREAKKGEIDVTLSMAFARGSNDLNELDEMAQSLIELASSRGGDQVVVRKVGEEAVFFGGSSEAREKQSKIKVRTMTNTIRNLISRSSNVIIAGHLEMDADCIGAALCMSVFAKTIGKEACIVTKSGGVEPMIADVMKKYASILESRHDFVSENEALNRLDDNTLVILVDHHQAITSNAPAVLRNASRIAVIDHHRRAADLDIRPVLFYLEAAASSTTEMTVELLPYLKKRYDILSEEANIMYLGIMIDTNHFVKRTGSRTFDVAKALRQMGADPVVCNELAQEPYDLVIKRSKIIDSGSVYRDNIVIAAVEDETIPRSIASQAADAILNIKGIDAAYVVVNTKDDTIITARSNGKINVQVIMELMKGGGHMSAAGLQRKDTTVQELKKELIGVLDDYYSKEKIEDESNIAE